MSLRGHSTLFLRPWLGEWDLINVYKCLMGGSKENGASSLSVASSDRTGGNRHRLKLNKFHLNIRKIFFTVRMVEHWNRLPGEVEESPSSQILKTRLDMVLGNLL